MSDFNENQNGEQINSAEVSAESVAVQQPSFDEAQLVGGVEPAKKKPVFLIIAIIIVILAAGCALAYNFIPWVKNNVRMLINKPEDYYSWVEQENLSSMADSISEAYGKGLDSIGSQSSEEVEIKADIDSASVGALIEELSGSPLSESGITLPSSIAIKAGADVNDGNVSGTYLITADDKTLATLNLYVQDGKYYYQIPELSPAYISMDLETLLDEAYAEMDAETSAFMQGYMDSVMSMSTDPDALKDILSEEELNELIVKYFTIVFENIDEVELEKGVSCEANGAKTEYNKLAAEVDEGTLFSICKDVLKEAKNDKTIIKLIEKFGLSKDDYTTAIEGLLDELGSYEVRGGETLFTMNVYVDSKGKICGRDIEIPEADNLSIGYMTIEDGSDKALDVNFMVDGEGIQVAGKSSEKSGKESGEAKLVLIGISETGSTIEIPVSYKDIETVNEDKGYCKGEFSIDLTACEGPVLTFVLDSDGKGQTVKSDITIDGTNYGTISIISKEGNTIETPAFDSSQKVYQLTEDGAEMEQYITEASEGLVSFLDNIGSAFGVDGLGSIFGAALNDPTDDFTGGIGIDDPGTGAGTGTGTGTVIDTETDDVTYDFSKLNIQINGQTVTLPSKINGITDLVKVEDAQLEAGDFKSYYSEDYSFGISVVNDSDKAAAPADCIVTGFIVSNGSAVQVSVDGFAVGSNIADVAAKYGAALEDPSNGEVVIYDAASDWNEIYIYYYDGKVDSIYLDIFDY